MPTILVNIKDLDPSWPMVAPFLLSSVQRPENDGDLDMPYLWTQCRAGNAFLIVSHEDKQVQMASVWEFEKHDYISFRCISIGARRGTMKEWLEPTRELVVRIAKMNGALSLMGRGRRWDRVFKEAKVNGLDYEVMI